MPRGSSTTQKTFQNILKSLSKLRDGKGERNGSVVFMLCCFGNYSFRLNLFTCSENVFEKNVSMSGWIVSKLNKLQSNKLFKYVFLSVWVFNNEISTPIGPVCLIVPQHFQRFASNLQYPFVNTGKVPWEIFPLRTQSRFRFIPLL